MEGFTTQGYKSIVVTNVQAVSHIDDSDVSLAETRSDTETVIGRGPRTA